MNKRKESKKHNTTIKSKEKLYTQKEVDEIVEKAIIKYRKDLDEARGWGTNGW